MGWGSASFVALLALSLSLSLYRLVMRVSVGLRIKGRPTEESMSGKTGDGPNGLADVVVRVLPVGYLPPPSKGKEKISEIRYPNGFEYLRATVRYAEAVGPNRVEPLYAKAFAIRYRPPSGVRIWCPNLASNFWGVL